MFATQAGGGSLILWRGLAYTVLSYKGLFDRPFRQDVKVKQARLFFQKPAYPRAFVCLVSEFSVFLAHQIL